MVFVLPYVPEKVRLARQRDQDLGKKTVLALATVTAPMKLELMERKRSVLTL